MKRDMDVIRTIILAVRNANADDVVNSVEGIDAETFRFHAQLLDEAGLVAGKVATDNIGMPKAAVLFRLTWAGHDFADSIVNETLWNKAKDKLMTPSLGWTFDILKDVLAGLIKKGLNL